MTRRTDWPDSTDDVPGGNGGSAGYAAHDGDAGEPGESDGPPRLPWSSRDAGGPGETSAFGESRRGHRGAKGSRSSRGSRAPGEPRGARDGGEGGEKPPQDPAERARNICLRLLTGTPRTRKQLADALHKREIPPEVCDEVLSRFEEVGLINDAAFADAWVESRHHGKGLARRALANELRTKGVDPALIEEAVGQLDSDQEEATARELVARKLRSTRGLERDKRLRRLAGMLARKGYPEGLAIRVVRRALEEEGEDTDGLDHEPF
ncbi:recombination regulator RecX [Streptomyces sp. NBC_00237]|uniref:recombination regulator RecX n=1 Tax=Streptomyces sp. NBC_00237 TaxID=2975687 RepID=UPI0022528614|nr:recombination regulator RecX [Streptomyces sp. NBC_00237]MCX5203791.1 recombination regulator RecX [Streptomyces sp. NBC_00237]